MSNGQLIGPPSIRSDRATRSEPVINSVFFEYLLSSFPVWDAETAVVKEAKDIMRLAEVEGLDAHVNSVGIRLLD